MTKAFKTHEITFLKLRISELEESYEDLAKDMDVASELILKLSKDKKELCAAIKEFAGRPSKDGANSLLDLVHKIEHGE